ncbi:YceI family protein (plasmid) [Pedobacter sp. BS3]|uniref:YceI family protein n=1 Tax=Pedobacter sp. BS3 TaxID=2567937 RepID=UPI0011ED097C|nr:YceI family protein [Pedobacter sp. BS3]TZF86242.1 YceI family protein [Pedobacter sp. BS3]
MRTSPLPLYSMLFILLTAFVPENYYGTAKWVIMQGCSLRVEGNTNVNKFNCEIANYGKPDTLLIRKNDKGNVPVKGRISLDVERFDCHNAVMTSDLRKTLKQKQFPKLNIEFISLSRFPELQKPDKVTGNVNIELAGVTRSFDVPYSISMDSNGVIHLIGSRDINFSDFNLTPPQKLGGMIRTENRLHIEFHLRMKAIE